MTARLTLSGAVSATTEAYERPTSRRRALKPTTTPFLAPHGAIPGTSRGHSWHLAGLAELSRRGAAPPYTPTMTTAPSTPPRGTRAKDSDRQQVIDALSEAHANGQLALDEYEERSRAASAAVTLQQLNQLTGDLQAVPDIAIPAAASASTGDFSTVLDVSRLAAVGPGRMLARALIGMAIVFAVIIGIVAGVAALVSGGSSFIGGGKPDLHHAKDFNAFVSDVKNEFGTTLVAEAVVYPDYAVVYVPVKDHPNYARSYYYDGEFDDPGTSSPRTEGEALVDLADLSGNVAEQLLAQAPEPLGVPDPDTTYLILQSWGDPAQPVFQVYASGEFGSGYLIAAADGHLLDAYPVND